MNNFYIYIYLDPRKSGQYCYNDICFLFEPMYVGKGKNNRYLIEHGRNKDFIDIINEIKKLELEPVVIKLYENLNEEESFKLETKLINEIGRLDLGTGTLINKTSGGQGNSGNIVSEETKKKLSEKKKGIYHPLFGKHHSEETKEKMSENRKGKSLSEEHRKKLSESHRGENHPLFGKHHSEESRNKMSDKKKGINKKIIDIKIDIEKDDLTQIEMAKKHVVSQTTISLIKTGKIWSHIKLGETT